MLTHFERELVKKTDQVNELIQRLAALKCSDAATKYAFAFGMQKSFMSVIIVYNYKEKMTYLDNYIAFVQRQIDVLEKI